MANTRSILRLAAIAVLVASVSACNSPTEPDPVVFDLSTKTFTGSIAAGGSASFPFTVVNPGDLTVTITQLSPVSSVTMGIHLGTWEATTSICTAQLSTTTATVNVEFGASPNSAGDYCVTIFDTGTLQAATDFTLRVTHY